MPLFPTPGKARVGFTLVELLSVVAITGLLAAILFPVVGRLRDSAHQTKCSSNLRQLGLAASLWQQDNPRDKLTPQLQRATATGTENISWVAALFPYLATKPAGYDSYGSAPDLTHCASARPESGWQKNSYGINILTSDSNWKPGRHSVRDPARTILAGDVIGTTLDPAANNSYQVLNPFGYGSASETDARRFATRHRGGTKGHLVFFDAHIEATDLSRYDWNTLGGFSRSAPRNPWKPW